MPVWILTLWGNPLVRKCAIYGAAILAICLCLRWWGNAQWAAGEQKGRVSATLELEDKYRADWQAKQKEIERDAAALAADRKALDAQAVQLAQSRRQLQETLSRSLNEISARQKIGNARIDTLSDAELVSAIREQSAKLAGAH